jgi:CheY-like chemotaxis protein
MTGDAPREPAILLVEDNGDDEFLALRALARGGFARVSVVADGCEAWEALSGAGRYPAPAHPDLVLLDLRLPKIDGIELLRRMRGDARTRDLAVFVLSSSEDTNDRSACDALGVLGCLTKPLDETGIERLRGFLAGR